MPIDIYQTSAIPPFPITGPPPLKRDISQTCWRFIPYNYSMYAIFTYIYHKFMVNLGTYSIHGAFGYFLSPNQYEIFNPFLPQQRWKKNIHLSSPRIWLNHRYPNLQNPETKQWLVGKWTGLKMYSQLKIPMLVFSCWFVSYVFKVGVENSSVTSFLTNNECFLKINGWKLRLPIWNGPFLGKHSFICRLVLGVPSAKLTIAMGKKKKTSHFSPGFLKFASKKTGGDSVTPWIIPSSHNRSSIQAIQRHLHSSSHCR